MELLQQHFKTLTLQQISFESLFMFTLEMKAIDDVIKGKCRTIAWLPCSLPELASVGGRSLSIQLQ